MWLVIMLVVVVALIAVVNKRSAGRGTAWSMTEGRRRRWGRDTGHGCGTHGDGGGDWSSDSGGGHDGGGHSCGGGSSCGGSGCGSSCGGGGCGSS